MKPIQRNKLFNRIGDAYNLGLAPWLYDEHGSLAVRIWCEAERQGNDPDQVLLNWFHENLVRLLEHEPGGRQALP